MATLEYTIATKTLVLKNNGKTIQTWHGNSGGNGGEHLPKGKYDVGVKPMINWAHEKIDENFQAPNGKGFFISLMPKFPTSRGKVGRFGIHPDGGKPGTHGCIGLTANAFTFLSQYNKYRPKLLTVK